MITIHLLRVTPDRKYLEFDVSCIDGYIFDKLVVTTSDGNAELNLGDFIYQRISNKETDRIPLSPPLYGGDKMYYVTFTIKKLPETPEIDRPCDCSKMERTGVAVDLSQFYFCMVKKALDLHAACQNQRNQLINIYLMYEMLKKAVVLERLDDASMWFNNLREFCNIECNTVYNPTKGGFKPSYRGQRKPCKNCGG